MADIFKSKATMPPMDNSPDVVRTALTMAEARAEQIPGSAKNSDMSVRSSERPRFGHGY